ncbi:MAG: hypothetical protein COW56_14110, partial [Rhodocyclales bacterium CG17_big_fil_post_rev_8_21_14_2_50_68_7]
ARQRVFSGPRSRVVCNCADVSESEIADAIAGGDRSRETLRGRLGCGAGCGACLREINRLLAAPAPRAS